MVDSIAFLGRTFPRRKLPYSQDEVVVLNISHVSPNVGPTSWTTTATIHGQFFVDVTSVKMYVVYGSFISLSYTVLSSTSIQVQFPPAPYEIVVGVSVTCKYGEVHLDNAFSYSDSLSVSFDTFSPTSGPPDSSVEVTITGSGFLAQTFDEVGFFRDGSYWPSSNFNVISDTEIVFDSPLQLNLYDDRKVYARWGSNEYIFTSPTWHYFGEDYLLTEDEEEITTEDEETIII